MKKIILSTILISTLFTSANAAIQSHARTHVKKTEEQKKEIDKNAMKTYVAKVEDKLKKSFKVKENSKGYADIKFIVDTNVGKVQTYFIYKRHGNENFMKSLKDYLRNANKIELPKYKNPKPLVEVRIQFKLNNLKEISENQKYSIFSKEKNIYKDYIKYLIKEKGYTRKRITEHLQAKNDTFIKSMLYAIYFDYVKHNEAYARKYYDILIKKYPEKLKERHEGILVSDWLIRNGNYNLVLELFPDRSCLIFKKPEKNQCYYMRGIAKYKKGLDYELELNIAKNYYPQADEIMKKIGGKK